MARTCKLCWGTGKIRRDPTEAEAKKLLRHLGGKPPKGGLIVTDICSCRIGRDIRKDMIRVSQEAARARSANPDMGSPGA